MPKPWRRRVGANFLGNPEPVLRPPEAWRFLGTSNGPMCVRKLPNWQQTSNIQRPITDARKPRRSMLDVGRCLRINFRAEPGLRPPEAWGFVAAANALMTPQVHWQRSRIGCQPILCVVGKLPALPGKNTATPTSGVSNLTNDSALGLVDELDDLRDLFARRQFLSDRFERLARVVFRSID